MPTTFMDLVKKAESEIKTISVEQAKTLHGNENVVFVDVRDIRELEREGKVPGAFNAPRGMLEFWIDPTSPYYKPVFAPEKQFVFYCAAGWRSALSAQTAQVLGLKNVCHIAGGFGAWAKDGGAVEALAKKS
jgi:rhodanese-related sulfurtransferase